MCTVVESDVETARVSIKYEAKMTTINFMVCRFLNWARECLLQQTKAFKTEKSGKEPS